MSKSLASRLENLVRSYAEPLFKDGVRVRREIDADTYARHIIGIPESVPMFPTGLCVCFVHKLQMVSPRFHVSVDDDVAYITCGTFTWVELSSDLLSDTLAAYQRYFDAPGTLDLITWEQRFHTVFLHLGIRNAADTLIASREFGYLYALGIFLAPTGDPVLYDHMFERRTFDKKRTTGIHSYFSSEILLVELQSILDNSGF